MTCDNLSSRCSYTFLGGVLRPLILCCLARDFTLSLPGGLAYHGIQVEAVTTSFNWHSQLFAFWKHFAGTCF